MSELVDEINTKGVLIPGPNHSVNMFLPEDHKFVLFMRGERPLVMEIDEEGDWTFCGEEISDGMQWPVVAAAVPDEFVSRVLSLTEEDIDDLIDKMLIVHKKMLN